MQNDQIFSLVGYQQNVGTSQLIGITAIPGQNWIKIRNSSGGTLMVGGATLNIAGAGYQIPAASAGLDPSITLPMCSGTLFMTAGGATAVTYVLIGRAQGILDA